MAFEVLRDEEQRKEVVSYLTNEINDVTGLIASDSTGYERHTLEAKWKKWRRQRLAVPEKEMKSYPWKKASNLSVPLMAGITNGIVSKIKASLAQIKPFWMIEAIDEEFKDGAICLETYINNMSQSKYHLNLDEINDTIIYDLVSLGTQFVEVPWAQDFRTFKRKDPVTGELVQVNKALRNSPAIIPIRIEDFITRTHYHDIQKAPWIAVRRYYSWHELKQMEYNGFFEDVDQIKEFYETELEDSLEEELHRKGLEHRDVKLYTILKVFCFWDVDGDGLYEDVVLFIEPVSGIILREEFNELGVRPIARLQYLPMPYNLYGRGVCEMLEHSQDEIDTLHNMRIDGAHLESLQMYVTRRGSGLGPLEEFRPAKAIEVDNPREDFIPIKFPSIGSATLQAEMLTKEYADRYAGASDYMMGFESRNVGTKATASGTMFLAQQGNALLNSVLEGAKRGFDEIGMLVMFQLVHNNDIVDYSLIPKEKKETLQKVLDMNVEDIPLKLKFSVRTTEVEKTEDAKRQAILTLVQLYTMYGREVFQILPTVYNPQVPQPIREAATKFFMGQTKLMSKILDFFDVDKTTEYLPYIKDIEMMVNTIEGMKTQQLGGLGGNQKVVGQMGANGSPDQGSPQSY